MIINCLLSADYGANFTKPTVLIALVLIVFSLTFVFIAKKLATAYLQKKHPDLDKECTEYKEKFLSKTLFFKTLAAGLAIAALVLTLI